MRAREPQLFHIAGAFLLGASWVTLFGLIVATSVLGFDGPGGRSADLLFGVPSAFRLAGWATLAYRGTWLAVVGILVDGALLLTIGQDWSGDTKGDLLLAALVVSNAIPGWWALTGRRWSAGFGLFGTLVSLAGWATVRDNGDEHIVMPLLMAAVILSWFADVGLGVWGLRHWRDQNLDEQRDLE